MERSVLQHKRTVPILVILLSFAVAAFAQPVQTANLQSVEYHPEWHPDGNHLLLTYGPDYSSIGLGVMDLGSGEISSIPVQGVGEADYYLSLSPDGSTLAFDARHPSGTGMVIYLVPIEGGEVVSPLGEEMLVGLEPNWSPDGTKLAFSRPTGSHNVISVLTLETREIVDITDIAGECLFPAWSPDGSEILFTAMINGQFDLYSVPSDGGAATQLTDDPADDMIASYSPDGRHILFCSDRAGNFDIWMMASVDHTLRQLTTHPGFDHDPSWSPDGNSIAFVSDRDEENWDIWVLNHVVTSVSEAPGLPERMTLELNTYPDPFNSTLSVTVKTSANSRVDFTLHNLSGRRVWSGTERVSATGDLKMELAFANLATGVYFLNATSSDGSSATRRVILMK